MNNYCIVYAIVEGKTEQIFIQKILAPYLQRKNIGMIPRIISKKGEKGGDVRFARVKNDIEQYLKQRKDTYVTLFVDFYGIKSDWPGLQEAKAKNSSADKAKVFNEATKQKVIQLFSAQQAEKRFIPYVAMHEFEALLFSSPKAIAEGLNAKIKDIEGILKKYQDKPEDINDSSETAPSKQLEQCAPEFKKTTSGISIAFSIGIEHMRKQCPLFNTWLQTIEALVETENKP